MKRISLAALCLIMLLFSGCKKQTDSSNTPSLFPFYSDSVRDAETPSQSSESDSSATGRAIEADKDEQAAAVKLDGEAFFPTDRETLYSYATLGSRSQQAYKIIVTAANEMTTGLIDLGIWQGDYTTEFSVAYNAVRNDWPELFWLPSSYVISGTTTAKGTRVMVGFEYIGKGMYNHYLVSKPQRDEMVQQLEGKIAKIINAAPKSEGPQKTQQYLHDVLCEEIDYTDSGANIRNVYGALVEGRAVCEGYARAFQLLCRRVGIQCDLICGESQGEPHMWNVVRYGNGWCHVDVTWDDQEEIISYLYYNLSDRQIAQTHDIAPHFTAAVADGNYNYNDYNCLTEEYGYFYRNDCILSAKGDFVQTAARGIRQSAKSGRKYAQFIFSNAAEKNDFTASFNRNYANIQKSLKAYSVTLEKAQTIGDSIVFFFH